MTESYTPPYQPKIEPEAIDPQEKRLAEVKIFLTDLKRKKQINYVIC